MKPNLIIQLQRIGDLVLSFPLAQKLLELEPDRPLWIVAEEAFYSALLHLSPKVLFLPHNAEILKQTSFKSIINLSHRKEGALLATQLDAEEIIGYYYKDNALFSHGFWQLYRLSLASNSKHNRFHWADLNALDMLSHNDMKAMKFAHPFSKNSLVNKKGKIGLFLGASSQYKRPDPAFFADLALKLIKIGYKPVFLGGKSEVNLGYEAERLTQLPALNLVNRFKLNELVLFMSELDLFITPDTGPMHIAAACGIPTLCLSMGNVNPYETSVANPLHYVLEAQMPCKPCWECTQNYECKEKISASHVVFLAKSLLDGKTIQAEGLNLYQTNRIDGLHCLNKIEAEKSHLTKKEISIQNTNTAFSSALNTKERLSFFWQEYFLRIAPQNFDKEILGMQYLKEYENTIYQEMKKAQMEILVDMNTSFKHSKQLDADYWLQKPSITHTLTSFLQLYLENANYSKQAYHDIFSYLEQLNY